MPAPTREDKFLLRTVDRGLAGPGHLRGRNAGPA